MNCKPGDLAVIVGGQHKENIGCMVEVLGSCHKPEWWRIRLAGTATAHSGKLCQPGDSGIAPDANLRPIRGHCDRMQVTTDRTIDEGVAA